MARTTKSKRTSTAYSGLHRSGNSARNSSSLFADAIAIAGSLLRNRQQSGAEQLDALARAAHSLAADMDKLPNLQTYVVATADQVEGLSDYVSEASLEEMVDDAASFARRHPLSTAAFAAAAGFGFVRLIAQNGPSGSSSESGRSKAKAARRNARSGTKASNKTRANGRGPSHERANAT